MSNGKEKPEPIRVSEEEVGYKKIFCRRCGRFLMKVSRKTEGEVEVNCEKCKTVTLFVIVHEKL